MSADTFYENGNRVPASLHHPVDDIEPDESPALRVPDLLTLVEKVASTFLRGDPNINRAAWRFVLGAESDSMREYARRIGKNPAHTAPQLLGRNAYGLAELHRAAIRQAKIVGNPGCFAVSCILGLAPAMKAGLVEPFSVICDCKTGVSGAGKKVSPTFHYPARYEQMNAYKLAGHQHVCEVERELSLQAGREVRVTFTAQVVPVCRGILSTLYGTLVRPTTEAEVLALYRDFFRESPFVRVLDSQAAVGTLHVRGTNFCNLVVSVDSRTNRLRIVSHIDNLMKGQAGSALQNMNLMCGFPETLGLLRPGIYP